MRLFLLLCLFLNACLSCAAADGPPATKSPEVEQVGTAIEGFFAATRNRDVLRLREVVDESLLIVEAGGRPVVHLFHSPNVSHLLAPEGNDDFKSLKIDRVVASISSSNPTVAMASFHVKVPISDSQRQQFQAMLDNTKDIAPEARAELNGVLDGMQMFSMLVKKDGKWKIVGLTVPK